MPDARHTDSAPAQAGASARSWHEPRWSRRLWALLVLLAAAIGGTTAVYVNSTERVLVATAGEGLALAAADLAAAIESGTAGDAAAAFARKADTIQLLRSTPARLGWALITREGISLLAGGALALEGLDPPPPMFVHVGRPGWAEVRASVPVVVGWAPLRHGQWQERAVLLAIDRQDVLAPTRIVLRTLLLAAGLVILPLLGLLIATDRRRRQLETRVRAHRDELEARVAERTTELERARNAALAAAQARADFFARMSHELRTPLSAVLGFAEILADPTLATEDRAAHGETIRRNGEHLSRVLDDVLDLARIEAGKLAVERRWCALRELVDGAVASLGAAARARGITLEVEYEAPLPDQIFVDPTRLRQILLNLVSNAVKLTEQGGVYVSVRLGGAPGAQRLLIAVRDTGPGIAPETMARLFTPFTQAPPAERRVGGGSGLGLAISRELARLLGGDVTVSSTPGVGSTFSVQIDPGPIDDVVRLAANSAEPGRPSVTTPLRLEGQVLLAEGAPDLRNLLRIYLETAGAVVETVDSGVEACLRVLGSRPRIDCVLLGLDLPGSDGLATAARLRAGGYDGPIVALGIAATPAERERCRQAGCDDAVAAPVDRRTLLHVVRAQLRRVRPVASAASAC